MMRKGFTLIEILIYAALSVLALMLVFALYSIARQTQQSSYSSFLVGGRIETALVNLRRDLEQTALATIQVYPNDQNPTEQPGLSFVSALSNEQLDVNAYGVPRWDHHVFYTLAPEAGKSTSNLLRWEQPIDAASLDLLPQTTAAIPSALQQAGRGFLPYLLKPDTKVEGLSDIGSFAGDKFGGFRVQFVTYDGTNWGTTSNNPTSNSHAASNAKLNTRLLEVELKVLQSGDKGKPDFYTIRFRVRPAY